MTNSPRELVQVPAIELKSPELSCFPLIDEEACVSSPVFSFVVSETPPEDKTVSSVSLVAESLATEDPLTAMVASSVSSFFTCGFEFYLSLLVDLLELEDDFLTVLTGLLLVLTRADSWLLNLVTKKTARITTIRANTKPIILLVIFMSDVPFLIIYSIIITQKQLNFSLKS